MPAARRPLPLFAGEAKTPLTVEIFTWDLHLGSSPGIFTVGILTVGIFTVGILTVGIFTVGIFTSPAKAGEVGTEGAG